MRKEVAKAVHVAIQTCAMALTIWGLVAVFRFHNEKDPPIDNLYSLHSWVGLTVVVLLSAQYLAGVYHFLTPAGRLPNTSAEGKAQYLAYHRLAGVLAVGLAVMAACLGLFEKLAFQGAAAITPSEDEYGGEPLHLMPAYYRANTIAVVLTIFAVLVAVAIARPAVSRPHPDPEAAPLLP